jgi:hypothetical protein
MTRRPLALLLLAAACTASPAPRGMPVPPSPTTAPATPSPTSSQAPPARAAWRAPYVPDLTAGARRTVVAVGGRVRLLDDRGRVLSDRYVPGGGYPDVRRGSDGTTYVVTRHDDGSIRLFRYDAGRFTELPGGDGDYPPRFTSGADVYRQDGETLRRTSPRSGAWALPVLADWQDGVKLWNVGDVPGESSGAVLVVVSTPGGPVAVSELIARCAVTSLGDGRQVVLDAPAPYQWELCSDAVVAPDGRIAVSVRDAGATDDRQDRLSVAYVDPVTLAVERRPVMPVQRGAGGDPAGFFVALPAGLVLYLPGHYAAGWVVDLRGRTPVAHRHDGEYGFSLAVAGPDAIWVWDYETPPRRIVVSTGATAPAPEVPPGASSVLRVR